MAIAVAQSQRRIGDLVADVLGPDEGARRVVDGLREQEGQRAVVVVAHVHVGLRIRGRTRESDALGLNAVRLRGSLGQRRDVASQLHALLQVGEGGDVVGEVEAADGRAGEDAGEVAGGEVLGAVGLGEEGGVAIGRCC